MKRRVFVSSVQKELQDERLKVNELLTTDPLLTAYFEPVLYELEPAASDGGLFGSLKTLDTCQIFVLIVGREYGSSADDGLSITHHEYRRARKQMPVLAFVLGEQTMKRDPRTEELIAEVKKDDIKYKRFHHVIELRNAVHASLLKLLRDEGVVLVSPSLRRVLAVFALLLLLVVILTGAPTLWRKHRFAMLRETQEHIQSIEDKIRHRFPVVEPIDHGNETYFDDSHVFMAEDVWRDGRLKQRILFVNGRPRAWDEFIYDENNFGPVGKKRYYLDDANKIFLVDKFAADGLLVRKLDCPGGLQRPCDDYFDVMRSPLPAAVQVPFYR